MEQKTNNAIKCLYGVIVINILTVAYGVFELVKTNQELKRMALQYPDTAHTVTYMNPMDAMGVYVAIVVTLAGLSAAELKQGKPWAWVGAICCFLLAAPSFAIPFSVIGLLSLFDERVRSHYLEKLDIKV